MSYEKHTVKDLKEVAEYFGVDISSAKGKEAIIAEINADGVEYADAVRLVLAPDEPAEVEEVVAPAQVIDDNTATVVVKMTRKNPTYEAEAHGRVYRFTKENPFVLLREDDADVILEREEGFRVASPKEVREFYG